MNDETKLGPLHSDCDKQVFEMCVPYEYIHQGGGTDSSLPVECTCSGKPGFVGTWVLATL